MDHWALWGLEYKLIELSLSGLKKRQIVQFGFQVKEVWFKKNEIKIEHTHHRKLWGNSRTDSTYELPQRKFQFLWRKNWRKQWWKWMERQLRERGRQGGRCLNFLHGSSPSQVLQNSARQCHYQLNWTSKFIFLGARNWMRPLSEVPSKLLCFKTVPHHSPPSSVSLK